MTELKPALDAALKVAALDGGSYQLGEHIFWSVLEKYPVQDETMLLDLLFEVDKTVGDMESPGAPERSDVSLDAQFSE